MPAERDLDATLELATVPVARFDSVGKPWRMAGVEFGAGFCGPSASGRDGDFFWASNGEPQERQGYLAGSGDRLDCWTLVWI